MVLVCACGPASGGEAGLRHAVEGSRLLIRNRHYLAVIDTARGELVQVRDLDGNGEPAGTALDDDRLLIRTAGMTDAIATSALPATGFRITDDFDFYLSVRTRSRLEAGPRVLFIERTYDFTAGPHIYEQVALLVSRPGEPRAPGVDVESVTWRVQTRNGVRVRTGADDLLVEDPGPLGGTDLQLEGEAARSEFRGSRPAIRHIVHGGRFSEGGGAVRLEPGRIFLAQAVFSLDSAADALPPALFTGRVYQFYPGLGLGTRGTSPRTFTFANWNNYVIQNDLIPLPAKPGPVLEVQKDFLIRISMFLRARMERDRWWPRWGAWSSSGVSYPDGDIFTAHARSFPQVAYTWAILTLHRKNGGWVHEPGDADVLYRTLRELHRHYVPDRDAANFADVREPEGIPYLAYSAARKEKTGDGPVGVLNTHADALHLAWILREAASLYGDSTRVVEWTGVLKRYHPGSRLLFRELYPARDRSRVYPGLLRYSIGNDSMRPWYSAIAFRGIAAGYLEAGDFEPEFVDAVERASLLDYDPLGYSRPPVPPERWGLSPFVARLCRVFPLALCFVGEEIAMSGTVGAAGLREVLTFGRLQEDGAAAARHPHDPAAFIVEGGGRKWILTNSVFVSDWVPGFWDERAAEAVPDSVRFGIRVEGTEDARGQAGDGMGAPPRGRWAAYRTGDTLFVMTDFPGAAVTLDLPGDGIRYAVSYREHENFGWSRPEVVARGELGSRGGGKTAALVLPRPLKRKTLVRISLARD